VAKLAYGPAEAAKAAADVARGHVSGAETPKATA
jgi:hypothetical protein